ncbi:MAG: hypothetical protein ACRDL7_09510 [Gaiellaceae bacterium]
MPITWLMMPHADSGAPTPARRRASTMEAEPSGQAPNHHTLLRVIAGVFALLATPSAIRDLLGMFRGGFDALLAIFALCTVTFVLMCGWFA